MMWTSFITAQCRERNKSKCVFPLGHGRIAELFNPRRKQSENTTGCVCHSYKRNFGRNKQTNKIWDREDTGRRKALKKQRKRTMTLTIVSLLQPHEHAHTHTQKKDLHIQLNRLQGPIVLQVPAESGRTYFLLNKQQIWPPSCKRELLE